MYVLMKPIPHGLREQEADERFELRSVSARYKIAIAEEDDWKDDDGSAESNCEEA